MEESDGWRDEREEGVEKGRESLISMIKDHRTMDIRRDFIRP